MTTTNTTITVTKSDYEVYEFSSGYFGIVKKYRHGGGCIFGGDSACEDHYNHDYINEVYDNWDGTLFYSEKYGYQIEQ